MTAPLERPAMTPVTVPALPGRSKAARSKAARSEVRP
jgi:hypothetical protein